MPAPPPPRFVLARGGPAPLQQSSTTCGSAALTVARMLLDPAFAQWVRSGAGTDQSAEPDPSDAEDQGNATAADALRSADPAARFATCEQQVLRRTNALRPGDRTLGFPWPRALGTFPTGARAELERMTGGTAYRIDVVRWLGRSVLGERYAALVASLTGGLPALLYVGNAALPRHVVLVVAGPDGTADVYDPARGTVEALDPVPFSGRRLNLAGWDVPWLTVSASGHGPG